MSLSKLAAFAALCALTLVTGLVAFLVLIGGTATASAGTGLLSGSLCATSGPINGLSEAAAANARIVAATASRRGGRQAAMIAVMTGLAESGLLVLANPKVPSGSRYASQGVGYDHDSVGIFQQRASWGSAAQRMDPVVSTNLFLDRLLALPQWRELRPWVAAQRVQRSAIADGSNYRAKLGTARRVVARITGDASEMNCGGTGIGTTPRGPRGRYGLPTRYTVPSAASDKERAAVGFALAQLGRPYVFGAEGPVSYDCSGLTQSAWAAAGVSISRVTDTQRYDGTSTSAERLAPGDLVLIPGAHGTLASPGHVGMFIGHGLVVHAPQPGEVVEVVTYKSYTAGGVSALRHIS